MHNLIIFAGLIARKLYNEGDSHPTLKWIMGYKKRKEGLILKKIVLVICAMTFIIPITDKVLETKSYQINKIQKMEQGQNLVEIKRQSKVVFFIVFDFIWGI